ncbi:MAG: Omp28-related outer membrane protein [Ignavibacteriae bacterium]|nr:Omp28-related outer membrane protein [Ignavibacteriota bacterium]
MKKIFLLTVLLFGLLFAFGDINAQLITDSNNVVLEEATGTWCGYCPCGHEFVAQILAAHPKSVVILYHGPPNYGSPVDPWAATGYPVIQLMGMTSYPTAVIGRSSGIISRSAWVGQANYQATIAPNVKIEVINQTLNVATRTINATINATALVNLTDTYNIYYVITENNLVMPQNFYASCGTAGVHNDYVHGHVSKALVNGTTGELLTSTPWNLNTVLTKQLTYTIPAGIDLANMDLNIIIYKVGTPYPTGAPVQNAMKIPSSLFTPTGIGSIEKVPSKYNLEQNYPNPFNPTTNIRFSVPKDGNATLKIYDVRGNEVATYLNSYIKAGSYNAPFDGSNLSSGVYYYRLSAGDFSDTKKMMLIK